MARKEIVELVTTSTENGLYRTLVTSAMPFPKRRVEALHAAGLDHVQISFQHSDPALADEIGGTIAFDRKVKAAALAQELDFPLTDQRRPPPPQHRRRRLDHRRWPSSSAPAGSSSPTRSTTAGRPLNRDALMPTRAQLERGEEVVMARTRAARAEARNPLGAARLLRGAAEAVHGRLGARRDPRAAERRRAALPGGGLDPRPEAGERARQIARRDLVRVGDASTPSAAPSGCRSPAAPARSTASTRTSAAAAARRWR